MSSDDAIESWMKVLHPRILKSNLIATSLYLAAWELFRSSVIAHVSGFYSLGWDGSPTPSPEYQAQVSSRDKREFRATMRWFKEQGAIVDADFEVADRARQHRNELAHDLPSFITRATHNVDTALMGELCELLRKIDLWWIRNIEIPTNPDFDDVDTDSIPDSEIHSGNMIFLGMVFDIVSGNDDGAMKFFDHAVNAVAEARVKKNEMNRHDAATLQQTQSTTE